MTILALPSWFQTFCHTVDSGVGKIEWVERQENHPHVFCGVTWQNRAIPRP